MAEVTRKLMRSLFRSSDLELDIFICAGIKQQAADALSPLKNNGEDKKTLDDEVPVFTAFQVFFACAPQTKITYFKFIEDPRVPIVLVIPEVCIMAGVMEKEKAEEPTLFDIIKARDTYKDCSSKFASVGKPSSRFNVDSHGVLARVYTLDGISQQVLPASLHSFFLCLYQYSLLAGHPTKRRLLDFMRKKLYCCNMANDI